MGLNSRNMQDHDQIRWQDLFFLDYISEIMKLPVIIAKYCEKTSPLMYNSIHHWMCICAFFDKAAFE